MPPKKVVFHRTAAQREAERRERGTATRDADVQEYGDFLDRLLTEDSFPLDQDRGGTATSFDSAHDPGSPAMLDFADDGAAFSRALVPASKRRRTDDVPRRQARPPARITKAQVDAAMAEASEDVRAAIGQLLASPTQAAFDALVAMMRSRQGTPDAIAIFGALRAARAQVMKRARTQARAAAQTAAGFKRVRKNASSYGSFRPLTVSAPGTHLAEFGATPSTATLDQLTRRGMSGFTGHGAYHQLHGHGAFWSDWGKNPVLRSIGKGIKTVVGSAVKSALQAGLSGQVSPAQLAAAAIEGAGKGGVRLLTGNGSYLSSNQPFMYGSGDYETGSVIPMNVPGVTQNNALINPGSATTRAPLRLSSGTTEQGDTWVRYREFLTDVIPGTPDDLGFFSVASINVNPGLAQSFPLASLLFGQYYTSYRIDQLVYQYVSTIGNSNTAVAGTVLMAPLYNVNDPPFASKRGMERASQVVTGGIQQNLQLGVECDRSSSLTTNLLIRTGPVPGGYNPALYDKCVVQVATSGVPSTIGSIGEIWVEYSIILQDLRVLSLQPLQLFDGLAIGFSLGPGTIQPSASGLANWWIGTNPTTPVGTVQLDQIVSADQLLVQCGWVVAGVSNSSWSIMDTFDINPLCCTVQRVFPGTSDPYFLIKLEMLAGQVITIGSACVLHNSVVGTPWTLPGSGPTTTNTVVSGPAVMGAASVGMRLSVAGDVLSTVQRQAFTAIGNGGQVTIKIIGGPYASLANAWITSTRISLSRTA